MAHAHNQSITKQYKCLIQILINLGQIEINPEILYLAQCLVEVSMSSLGGHFTLLREY